MAQDYFVRLSHQTPTRMWVNNPTLDEANTAVAAGAVSCTTNPTYCANMLKRDPAWAMGVVDRIVRNVADDDEAAHLIQQEMVQRIMPAFMPLHRTDHWQGVVSVQGDPRRDTDADHIIEECLDDHRRLPQNYIAKIPVVPAGLRAIEVMIQNNIPVIATEVFSLAQMVRVCELYQRVCGEVGHSPAFFVTHITGIFDEYLQQAAHNQGIRLAPHVLAEAGFAVCCRQYALFKERRYPGIMLGGGARATRHFTDFVGTQMHITINWSTAKEILVASPPLDRRSDNPPTKQVVDELLEKLIDFRRAWDTEGLRDEEFAEYGPVQHFRDKFIAGWDGLKETIRQRRLGNRGA